MLSVKDRIVHSSERDGVIAFAEKQFGVRAILLGENSKETFGPNDFVSMLRNIDAGLLPWEQYHYA